MNEKTEELRDLFVTVTDSDTVTESQEQSRGSLADRGDVSDRLERVVEQMRERYDFRTDCSTQTLCEVVSRFYEDADDAAIADALDVDEDAVVRARFDLHLVRESDTDAPFDVDALRAHVNDDPDVNALATDLDADADAVRHVLEALRAEDESRRANDRFRDEFASVLSDSDLSNRMARDAREDGLEEATEGMEVDVDF